LKRELKVLEIVKREAFEAPICSFFFHKIATHPRENSAHSLAGATQGLFFGRGRGPSKVRPKGGRGGGGATFLLPCLAPSVSCKRVFVLGEMGALFLGR